MLIDWMCYRLLRRGQHWSVVDGIGDTLRADALDAAIDAVTEDTSNAKVRGPEAALSPEAPSRLPGYAGAAKDEKC